MERIIGKYTLNVTSEEINKDNFFKHSVSVLKPEFIYIDSGSNPTIYTILYNIPI